MEGFRAYLCIMPHRRRIIFILLSFRVWQSRRAKHNIYELEDILRALSRSITQLLISHSHGDDQFWLILSRNHFFNEFAETQKNKFQKQAGNNSFTATLSRWIIFNNSWFCGIFTSILFACLWPLKWMLNMFKEKKLNEEGKTETGAIWWWCHSLTKL